MQNNQYPVDDYCFHRPQQPVWTSISSQGVCTSRMILTSEAEAS